MTEWGIEDSSGLRVASKRRPIPFFVGLLAVFGVVAVVVSRSAGARVNTSVMESDDVTECIELMRETNVIGDEVPDVEGAFQLNVAYDGVDEQCGTTLFTSQTVNTPVVTFDDADADAYYTLVMMDPDAPGAEENFVLHWRIMNIPSSEGLAGGDEIDAYISPVANEGVFGDHRYSTFLFIQPDGLIAEEDLPAPVTDIADRVAYDVNGFLEAYNLGPSATAGWFYEGTVRYVSEEECVDGMVDVGIIPDVVSAVEGAFALNVTYDFLGAQAWYQCTANLSLSTVAAAPTVSFDDGDASDYYTLVMVDPDVPATTNRTLADALHWRIMNIPSGATVNTNTSTDLSAVPTQLETYFSPTPGPDGEYHRYTMLLFRQPDGLIAEADLPTPKGSEAADRIKFDLGAFVSDFNLGTAVAGYWFGANYNDEVDLTPP